VRSDFNSFATEAAAAAARAETECWRRRRTTNNNNNNNNMCYKGMGRFLCVYNMCTYIRRSAIKIIASHCVYYVLNYECVFLWMFSLYLAWKISLPTFTRKHDRDIMYYHYSIPSHVQHIPIHRTYIHTYI